ncbi:MAG: hypothetical protein ABF646_02150 [Acetobacter papayae]
MSGSDLDKAEDCLKRELPEGVTYLIHKSEVDDLWQVEVIDPSFTTNYSNLMPSAIHADVVIASLDAVVRWKRGERTKVKDLTEGPIQITQHNVRMGRGEKK